MDELGYDAVTKNPQPQRVFLDYLGQFGELFQCCSLEDIGWQNNQHLMFLVPGQRDSGPWRIVH